MFRIDCEPRCTHTKGSGLQVRERDVVEIVLEGVDECGHAHFERLHWILVDGFFKLYYKPERSVASYGEEGQYAGSSKCKGNLKSDHSL